MQRVAREREGEDKRREKGPEQVSVRGDERRGEKYRGGGRKTWGGARWGGGGISMSSTGGGEWGWRTGKVNHLGF